MPILNENYRRMKMTLSDSDLKIFKKWLRSHLAFGPVTVIFNKKDGTERVMLCTTNPELVPKVEITESSEPKKERKVNEEVMPVYDLEAKSWKSFRWDSVKQVRFEL